MNKGDVLRLITVKEDYRPGKRVTVKIKDVKDDIVTVTRDELLYCNHVFSTDSFEPYFIKDYIPPYRDGKGTNLPGVMQLKRDEILEQFFSQKVLTPHLNSKTLRYEYGHPEGVLKDWVIEGFLEKRITDWYYGCPECDSPLAVRKGCRMCKSYRLDNTMLIRHKSCGYIGKAKEFDDWLCPKCDEKLVTGQYASMRSPSKCLDCTFLNDSHPYYIGRCLNCRGIFGLDDAMEVPIFTYFKTKM